MEENMEIPLALRTILPQDFNYQILYFSHDGDKLNAVVACNICDRGQISKWLREFEETSKQHFTVVRTYVGKERRCKYRAAYKCHHCIRCPSEKRNRNTFCPARIDFNISHISKRTKCAKRGKFLVPWNLPCCITLKLDHNHSLNSVSTLRFLPVSSQVDRKLIDLFKMGHTPLTAVESIQFGLQCEEADDFYTASADRSACPDLQHAHYVFRKVFQTKSRSFSSQFTNIDDHLHELQVSHCDSSIHHVRCGEQYGIVTMTPLMSRVHQLVQQSSEVMFVDSFGGGVDRKGFRVYLLLTTAPACGGLPLGAILTSVEDEQLLIECFETFKKTLPPLAFYGSGRGPSLIMINDSSSLRNAITKTWPEAKISLCCFHLLQAYWRWMANPVRLIKKEDKMHLLRLFKDLLYSNTEDELVNRYVNLQSDPVLGQYTHCRDQMEAYWVRREEWIVFSKLNEDDVNSYASSLCQESMRVLNDKILHRTRAFNIIPMVDFVLTTLMSYYRRRLLDVANGREQPSLQKVFQLPNSDMLDGIVRHSDVLFEVPCEGKLPNTYFVDMETCLCTCSCMDPTGDTCKHQFWVYKHFGLKSPDIPIDGQLRETFHLVATGLHSFQTGETSGIQAGMLLTEQDLIKADHNCDYKLFEISDGSRIERILLSIQEIPEGSQAVNPDDCNASADDTIEVVFAEFEDGGASLQIEKENTSSNEQIEMTSSEEIETIFTETMDVFRKRYLGSPKEAKPVFQKFLQRISLGTDSAFYSLLHKVGSTESPPGENRVTNGRTPLKAIEVRRYRPILPRLTTTALEDTETIGSNVALTTFTTENMHDYIALTSL